MYQFSGYGDSSYIVMHLNIDSVRQKHTVSLTGNAPFIGNFGLWQGLLNAGDHKVTLEYCAGAQITNTVSQNLDWQQVYISR